MSEAAPSPRKHRVALPPEPGRLDAVLASTLNVSRGRSRRLLEQGRVEVDGQRCSLADKAMPVTATHHVAVYLTGSANVDRPIGQDLGLTELGRGEDWIALDKPIAMPVHPLAYDEAATVLNHVVLQDPQVVEVGEKGLRGGVVHRLDVPTSGALLFALGQSRWEQLRQAFSEHRVTKHYHAVVKGQPDAQREIELWLKVAQHRPARVVCVQPDAAGARRCRLSWKVVQCHDDYTLLDISLETGFLHQIRVTLATLGFPVVGDDLYSTHLDPGPQGRLMLHCRHLSVAEIEINSPTPPGFFSLTAARHA